ncbi:hypothetical protein [Kribbella endophytica]
MRALPPYEQATLDLPELEVLSRRVWELASRGLPPYEQSFGGPS